MLRAAGWKEFVTQDYECLTDCVNVCEYRKFIRFVGGPMTSRNDLSTRLDALEHALQAAQAQRDPHTRARWLEAVQAAADITRHDIAAQPPDEARAHPVLHLLDFSRDASAPAVPLPNQSQGHEAWSETRSRGTAQRP